MRVTLNGQDYILDPATALDWGYVEQLSDVLRQNGIPTRQDNVVLSRLRYGHERGVGHQSQRRETGRGVGGMRFATANTMHDVITLQILAESQSQGTNDDHLRAYIPAFKGNAHAVFEENYSSGSEDFLAIRTWDAANDQWTNGLVFGSAGGSGGAENGCRGWDAVVHKGSVFILCTAEMIEFPVSGGSANSLEGSFNLVRTTDPDTAGAYTNITNTPFDDNNEELVSTTINRRNNFDDDRGKLLDFGEKLLAALYEDPDANDGSTSQIRIYESSNADSSATFSSVVNIPSGDGPKAFVSFTDRSGIVMPCLVTQESAYVINLSAGSFEQLIPSALFAGNSADGRNSIVANDGRMYLTLAGGDLLRISRGEGGGLTIDNIGPQTHGDGLPSTYEGHANFIADTPSRWLFVAYGGHASGENATILAYDKYSPRREDGEVDARWHVMYDEPDANVDITHLMFTSFDDGAPRLHFALEGSGASEMLHQEQPLAVPGSGVTQKFEASSYVQYAEDDMFDGHNASTIVQGRVLADDLDTKSNDNEKIVHDYGLDGADWDDTNLGTYASDDKDLTFSSGAGVSAKTVRNELTLHRGSTNTNTPLLKDFELNVYTNLQMLRRLRLPISLERTYDATGVKPEEQLANLETVITAETQVSLTIGGFSAFNVRVRQPPTYNLRVVDSGDGAGSGTLTGTVTIQVEEALEGASGASVVTASGHSGSHEEGGDDELLVEELGTDSTTTTHVLKPDGSGGVEFVALADADFPEPFVESGRYKIPGWYVGSIATRSVTAGWLLYIPIFVAASETFDRISISIDSAGAGSTVARLGIYEMADSVPGDLVLDAGTVAVDSTGDKEITINQTLARGYYALVYVSDGGPTLDGAPLESNVVPANEGTMGSFAATSGETIKLLTGQSAQATGGLNDPATAPNSRVSPNFGVVRLRAS